MNAENLIKEAVKNAFGEFLATIGGADVATHLERAARLEALLKKPLLSSVDVEELYGIPTATLATWRSRAMGPDYTKAEGSVFYTHQQIERWIARNEVKIKR